MKKSLFALLFVFAAVMTSVSAQTVAFTNVSVIPMDRERVLANQTVVIKNGLIAEIGDAKKVKLPKDAVRVDGTGKFLMPGLSTCTLTCCQTAMSFLIRLVRMSCV